MTLLLLIQLEYLQCRVLDFRPARMEYLTRIPCQLHPFRSFPLALRVV